MIATLVLWTQADGQRVEKVGDFFRITTEHYVIETDVSLDFAWEMARHMESIFAEYSNQMKGFSGYTPAGFNVRVFQKRADYAAQVGSQYRNTSGIFMPSRKLLAAYMEDQPPNEVLATLYHEGFHQFMHHMVSEDVPPWLNEGLAELFQYAVWNGRRFELGDVPPYRLQTLKDAFWKNRHIPLRTLVTMDSGLWIGNVAEGRMEGRLQYAEAWALVYFLGRANERLLNEYIALVKQGAKGLSAFQATFGEDVEALEKEWIKFVLSLSPTPRYVCHQNLAQLAFLVGKHRTYVRRIGGNIEAYKKSLLDQVHKPWELRSSDGTVLRSSDTGRIQELFICPEAKPRKSGASSYLMRFAPKKDLDCPDIICDNHPGIVIKAVYGPGRGGEDRYQVVEEVRRR